MISNPRGASESYKIYACGCRTQQPTNLQSCSQNVSADDDNDTWPSHRAGQKAGVVDNRKELEADNLDRLVRAYLKRRIIEKFSILGSDDVGVVTSNLARMSRDRPFRTGLVRPSYGPRLTMEGRSYHVTDMQSVVDKAASYFLDEAKCK